EADGAGRTAIYGGKFYFYPFSTQVGSFTHRRECIRLLITGGAGFIGSNLAARGLSLGHEVTILDTLARPGTALNLEWLQSQGPLTCIQADIRDFSALLNLFHTNQFDAVFHQVGQVAVTISVKEPRTDFEVNALGTFNLLEAIRLSGQN